MDAAVSADGVTKTYGDTVAVDDVTLSVDPGEAVALLGPNGAGKTTLVRSLVGTATPDAGRVRLLGRSPDAVDAQRIGFLPQSFSPPSRLTARELLRYYAGLYDDARDPDAVLADVGLDRMDVWYENLSGGQQRRACVAAALVNDPDVLFLDEPTAGIDPAGRRSLQDLLAGLRDSGTTLVLTTHDTAAASRLADRVFLLAGGRLAASGTPADLVAAHGGRSRVRVETEAPVASVSNGPYEVRAAPSGDGLLFEGVEPAEVGDVVRLLDDRGVAFGALTWAEPDLEDVYLALAGNGRDESPESRARADARDAPTDDGLQSPDGARDDRAGDADVDGPEVRR